MILILRFDENNWMIEQNFAGTIMAVKIKHWWFSCSIVACHAIEPGSIHGRCKAAKQKILPKKQKLKFFIFLLFHCQKRGNYQNTQLSSKPQLD